MFFGSSTSSVRHAHACPYFTTICIKLSSLSGKQASEQKIQTSLYVPQPKLRYASRSQAFYCKILCMFRHVRQALLLLFILSWASLIEAPAFHHNLQHICGSIQRYVIVFYLFFFSILGNTLGNCEWILFEFSYHVLNYSVELYFPREYRNYRVEPSTESRLSCSSLDW